MIRPGNYFFENRFAFLLAVAEASAGAAFAFRHQTVFLHSGRERLLLWSLFSIGALSIGVLFFFLLDRVAANLADKFCLSREFILNKLAVTFSPILLLLLDFVQEKYVLRNISLTLILLAAAGIVYLQMIFFYKLLRSRPQTVCHPNHQIQGNQAPKHRTFLKVFLASFGLYSLILLSGILPSQPFTGDEPHYLLIAQSMVRDLDIDVYNNYLHKDYLEFYPGEISWHAYPGKKGPAHLYSKHFPALPLLLTPAYWCGDRLGKTLKIPGINLPNERNIRILLARETMTLFAALLVSFFFMLVWEFTQNRRTAFYSWLFFAFTPPILFYFQLLFSEIPVTLILLLILRQALFKESDSNKSLFWSGLGIAVIPWFGIKYIILAAAILAIFLYLKWRILFKQQWKFLFFFGPLLVSSALFLAFLWQIYGMISPFAVYFGTAAAKAISFSRHFSFSLRDFIVQALAFFIDQRLGLFIYSPLYVLFIPGIVITFKKCKKVGGATLILAAAYWIFLAYNQVPGNYGPPERLMLPVGFILALFVAATFSWAKNRSTTIIFRILAAIAILLAFLAVTQPRLFYHEGLSIDSWNKDTQSYLLTSISNVAIDFSRLVPNLIYLPDFSWLILIIWLTLITAICIAVLQKERRIAARPPNFRIGGHALWIFILLTLLTIHQFFNVRLNDQDSLAVPSGKVYFQDGNTFGPELGGFWTRGNCLAQVVLKSPIPLKRLRLEMTSRSPIRASVRIGSLRMEHNFSTVTPSSITKIFPKPDGIPWQGSFLYLVRFKVINGFVPTQVETANYDLRFLGVFSRLISLAK
ncbi:MAG: hypothetical protein ABII93_06775 [Chrysiogenia bacterium]